MTTFTSDAIIADSLESTAKGHSYVTASDPAVKPGVYQYSRRIEDLSTYLVTFNNQSSTPFICLTGAAEHDDFCVSFPTPCDLSETFVRRYDLNDFSSTGTRGADRATELITAGSVGSHREVVHKLLQALEQDKTYGLKDEDQQLFGRVTYLWQEIKNRIEENHIYDGRFDMSNWPGGSDGI